MVEPPPGYPAQNPDPTIRAVPWELRRSLGAEPCAPAAAHAFGAAILQGDRAIGSGSV